MSTTTELRAMEPRPMRVFRINDCDWWMAETLAQAIEDYMRETGLPRDEAVDKPGECDAEQLDKLRYVDDDDHSVTRSFREELARRSHESQFFASSEWQ